MEPTFDYFALRYLNQWLEHDSIYSEQLKSDSFEVRLKGFSTACTFYGIARNLPKKFDLGVKLRRYEPALKLLDKFDADSLKQSKPLDVINAQLAFEMQLSKIYGGDRVISLMTKILWLKYQTSVIIYDSRAKNTLGFKSDDLARYTIKWLEEFLTHEQEIVQSCKRLKDVQKYSINPQLATKEYVSNVSSQTWFQERVFDMYLWHHGG